MEYIYSLNPGEEEKIKELYMRGNAVAFESLEENSRLIKAEKGASGYCVNPECKGRVKARVSRYNLGEAGFKRAHFYHRPANSECARIRRKESLWHLMQKACFPVTQVEKVVINKRPEVKKRYQCADVHIIDPSPKKQREYLIEHENTLQGRDILDRDAFYTANGLRASWVVKCSQAKVRSELHIVEASKKILRQNFKTWQVLPEKYYEALEMPRAGKYVLFKGDLECQHLIHTNGMAFLNISSTAYLAICPDRNGQGIKIDIGKNEWAFGKVYTTSEFLNIFRPGYRTDALLREVDLHPNQDKTIISSARRMRRYASEAGERIQKHGGIEKYLRFEHPGNIHSLQYSADKEQYKKASGDQARYTKDGFTPEQIQAATSDPDVKDRLIHFLSDLSVEELDRIMAEQLNASREWALQEEGLHEYLRENVKRTELDWERFHGVSPNDHSIFMHTGTTYPPDFESVLTEIHQIAKENIEQKEEKRRKEQQEAERRRQREIETKKKKAEVISKGYQFIASHPHLRSQETELLYNLKYELIVHEDFDKAYIKWVHECHNLLKIKEEEEIQVARQMEMESKRVQASINQNRALALKFLQSEEFFVDKIDAYMKRLDALIHSEDIPYYGYQIWQKETKAALEDFKRVQLSELTKKEQKIKAKKAKIEEAKERKEFLKATEERLRDVDMRLGKLNIPDLEKEQLIRKLVDEFNSSTQLNAHSSYRYWEVYSLKPVLEKYNLQKVYQDTFK